MRLCYAILLLALFFFVSSPLSGAEKLFYSSDGKPVSDGTSETRQKKDTELKKTLTVKGTPDCDAEESPTVPVTDETAIKKKPSSEPVDTGNNPAPDQNTIKERPAPEKKNIKEFPPVPEEDKEKKTHRPDPEKMGKKLFQVSFGLNGLDDILKRQGSITMLMGSIHPVPPACDVCRIPRGIVAL